jgi:hypothetical protein
MEKELLANVLQIQGQLKVLHWQTTSYAEHKAFGKTYDKLDDLLDSLIETYSGKYQRPVFGGVKQITFADYENLKVDKFLEAFEDFMSNAFMAQQDGELSNIKDEILAAIQTLKYLLTLK